MTAAPAAGYGSLNERPHGGQAKLLGYSQPVCRPGGDGLPCPLYLFWQAQRPLTADLKLTAMLVDGYAKAWSAPLDARSGTIDFRDSAAPM